MKRLDVNYYITKDETVLYAVPKDNWTIVAYFNTSLKQWEIIPDCNEMIMTHEDDIYPYGECGALLVTGGVYPDEVLAKSLNEWNELFKRGDRAVAEAKRLLKDYDERTKR